MRKLTPKEKAILTENKVKLYDKLDGRCQNCDGRLYPMKYIQFAHIKSRNNSTVEEYLTRFLYICADLHNYQHWKSPNLKKTHCVQLFLKDHFNGLSHRVFYMKFIKNKGLFQDE